MQPLRGHDSTVYELIASRTGSHGTWMPTAPAAEWLIGTLKVICIV